VPELITGGLGDATDRGDPDPRAAAALTAFAAGQGSEHAVLTALASARLLVPVVAVLAGPAPGGGTGATGPGGAPAAGIADPGAGRLRAEKVSEMALPTLVGSDGRHAVLAFTCLSSLTRWRPDARPVPVQAGQVWLAGTQEASAVVVDVAGPVPFAVDGARLAALAGGRPAPMPHEDPDLRAAAGAAFSGEPVIAQFALLPGEGGSDLTVQVTLAPGFGPGDARAQEAIQRSAERIMAGGGDRVRRGITVAATVAGRPGPGAGGP
jgi:SseB protein N-terminal domain